MKLNDRFLLSVVAVVVAAAGLVGNAGAATFVVGDNLGWTVPNGGAATYANWASRHVFRVGDVLVFNFPTGAHDVAQVTRQAHDGCSSTAPIALATVGPANFTLNSTGANYYICTFGQHCTLGQKLAINVSAASPTPAPAPAPAPPSGAPIPNPMPAPSQPPSGSPSMPPSPTSGSPGPTPSASTTPPSPTPGASAPGSDELSPGSNTPPTPFLPPGTLSPPPAPSSAATISVNTLIVVFVSMSLGIMI